MIINGRKAYLMNEFNNKSLVSNSMMDGDKSINFEEVKDQVMPRDLKKDAINEKIKNLRAKIGLNENQNSTSGKRIMSRNDQSRDQSRNMNADGLNDNDMTRTFAMDVNESFGGINNKALGKET
jgi:hypothetical protein